MTFDNRVSPGFFKMLGIPLVAGRDFDERDTMAGPMVAIVNDSFASLRAGTDHPFGEYKVAADIVEKMDWPQADKDKVYEGNARRLLGL